MAASTISIKLSPREYAQMKRFLEELSAAKTAKARRAQPVEVHPVNPQERHELQADVKVINDLLGSI